MPARARFSGASPSPTRHTAGRWATSGSHPRHHRRWRPLARRRSRARGQDLHGRRLPRYHSRLGRGLSVAPSSPPQTGAHWRQQRSEAQSVASRGVAFPDATHGWAVGGNERGQSVIVATTRRRRPLAGAEVASPSACLSGVAFPDATHGWAVGNHGTILATTDGGAHWKKQKSATKWWLNGVAFPDATHGWAVGGNGTRTRASSSPPADGGAHWQAAEVRTTMLQYLFAVAFPDATHGWAVGEDDARGAWATSSSPPATAAPTGRCRRTAEAYYGVSQRRRVP